MIYDLLNSNTRDLLSSRHAALATAFTWLTAMPADIPDGITELMGSEMYVNVHGYATKSVDDCRWESHRHTVDLQYCIAGGELIEWKPTGTLEPILDYDAAKDVEHWRGETPLFRLRMIPGSFVIFLPNEPHRPQLNDAENARVRKLVVKIRATLLGL